MTAMINLNMVLEYNFFMILFFRLYRLQKEISYRKEGVLKRKP